MSAGSTTCELKDNHWILNGDPFVLHRADSIFPLGKRSGRELWIPATPEQSRELMWFRQRHPMKVTPETLMRKQAAEFLMRSARAARILSADYVPETVEFASGFAPRKDQLVASELLKATGQLLLADKVGIGKTLSCLAAIADGKLRPSLVVLPPHLAIQWQRQARKFLPRLRTHIIEKTTPYDLDLIIMCPSCGYEVERVVNTSRCPKCRIRLSKAVGRFPDIIMCSYTKLKGWTRHLPEVCKSIFFDEGHGLRRSDSDKWRAATAVSSQMSYRCICSATPLFNYGGESWNIIQAIAPGFLGSKESFRNEWCGYGGGDGREPPLKDPDAFGAYLRASNIMLRRSHEDVGMVAGECNRIIQPIEASEDVFRKATDRAGELARILLSDNKLRQGDSMRAAGEFDSMMRQATGLAKAPFVAAFVEMLLEQGLPTVLYAWHHGVYDVYEEKLRKYNPVFYTGNQTAGQKEASFHKFMSGESDLFICSLRSGEGLDGLQTRSSTCVFGELDWTEAVHVQCLSDDMEVLTRRGFVGRCRVDVGDDVCGYDASTGEMRWVQVDRKVERELGDEKMVEVNGNKVDLRVTVGHRMVVSRYRRTSDGNGWGDMGFCEAGDLLDIARASVPVSGEEVVDGIDLTIDECSLIGLFMSDGNLSGTSCPAIQINQMEHQPWKYEIEKILDSCGLRWTVYRRTNGMLVYAVQKSGKSNMWSKWDLDVIEKAESVDYAASILTNRTRLAVYKKLRQLKSGIKVKTVSREQSPGASGWSHLEKYMKKNPLAQFQQATRNQLLALLHGFWLGDGSKCGTKTRRIHNTNIDVLEGFQSLCVRRGISARLAKRRDLTSGGKPYYTLSYGIQSTATLPQQSDRKLREVESNPKEIVWCLSNVLQTLVVRRNGKVSVVGNCLGRLDRDGQKEPVTAYFLLSDYGLDPVMSEVLVAKKDQLDGLVGERATGPVKRIDSSAAIRRLAQKYLSAGR